MFCLLALFLITNIAESVYAADWMSQFLAPQKNRKKAAKPKAEKQEDFSQWVENPICKVTVIDSLVVDENDIVGHLPLPQYLGRLHYETSMGRIVHENDFGDQRFFSAEDAKGESRIYRQTLLAGKWSEPEMVTIKGENYDFHNPVLMPDGMTLFFAAREKNNEEDDESTEEDNSLSLYTTTFDSPSNAFLEPQRLPYPFVSDADDLYYIEDEVTDLAWLVTKRHQKTGKACIYTMGVTHPWEYYDSENTEPQKLKALARLTQIADTWTSETHKKEVTKRLEEVKEEEKGKQTANATILFVVNDRKVYRSINDFRTEEGRRLFLDYAEKGNRLYSLRRQLAEFRRIYHNTDSGNNRKIRETILSTEHEIAAIEQETADTAKRIREMETE